MYTLQQYTIILCSSICNNPLRDKSHYNLFAHIQRTPPAVTHGRTGLPKSYYNNRRIYRTSYSLDSDSVASRPPPARVYRDGDAHNIVRTIIPCPDRMSPVRSGRRTGTALRFATRRSRGDKSSRWEPFGNAVTVSETMKIALEVAFRLERRSLRSAVRDIIT